jgi:hypothetical protein
VRRLRFITILALAGVLFGRLCAAQQTSASNTSSPTVASEDWQKQFDDICSKTQDAMTLSVEELKALIQKCDSLEPQIQRLDDTRKKVYLRRLGQCRGLYAYVLDSKSKDK